MGRAGGGGGAGRAPPAAPHDAGISAAGAEAHVGAEGEAGEEDGPMEVLGDPCEGGADVFLFAVSVVEEAFAAADAAEVEAEDGQAEAEEGLGGVVDDLGVHGAAGGRVRVADEGGEGGVGLAGVEEGFELAGGAAEIVDGLEVRWVHEVQFSG